MQVMTQYLSILRGINVSGHRKLPMKELKALYGSLGFTEVQTYIQSGNAVFRASGTAAKLAEQIEEAIRAQYGYEVPVIVVTQQELRAIVEENPFLGERDIETDKLHVTLLAEKPGNEAAAKLVDIDYSPDRFVLSGKAVYLYCPGGYGNTKLSNAFFENKLKVKATTRNWKTMNTLLDMMG